MALILNGDGTVTGLAVGGLPDGTVDSGTLATDSVTSANIADGTIVNADINSSAAIDGSKLTGVGKVLQVVQGTYSTAVANSTTTYADTGLTATITPTSTTSKILVIVAQNGGYKSDADAYNALGLKLVRDATDLTIFAQYAGFTGTTLHIYTETLGTTYLDSPASISAIVYKTQFKNTQAASAVNLQRQSTQVSTITLMEIGV